MLSTGIEGGQLARRRRTIVLRLRSAVRCRRHRGVPRSFVRFRKVENSFPRWRTRRRPSIGRRIALASALHHDRLLEQRQVVATCSVVTTRGAEAHRVVAAAQQRSPRRRPYRRWRRCAGSLRRSAEPGTTIRLRSSGPARTSPESDGGPSPPDAFQPFALAPRILQILIPSRRRWSGRHRATGLPKCDGTRRRRMIDSRATHSPRGGRRRFFGDRHMSGLKSKCSEANILPVRPIPDCTSSAMTRMPWSRATCWTRSRNFRGGTT